MAQMTLIPLPDSPGVAIRSRKVPSRKMALSDAGWTARMTARQNALWTAVLAVRVEACDGIDLAVSCDPVFDDEIRDQYLFSPTGVFQRTVFRADVPRISAIKRIGGVAVAHAMLMPTTADDCGASPVPRNMGDKAGLLGVFVSPLRRGRGYARECMTALSVVLNPALDAISSHFCLTAESRIIPWCGPIFRIPVVARWNTERPEHLRARMR